jgi:hypothetical protein
VSTSSPSLAREASAARWPGILPTSLQIRLFGRRLQSSPPELPVDPVLGDHLYWRRDYDRMFAATGFSLRSEHLYPRTRAFLVTAKQL